MKPFSIARSTSVLFLGFAGMFGALAEENDAHEEEAVDEKVTPPVDKEFLPLDLLPPGTVLEEVRLPRYREGKLLGEVVAARMTIESANLVTGDEVDIHWSFGKGSEAMTEAHLPKANYDFKSGLMRATGGVTILDPRFTAMGSDLDLNLSLQRGWLGGPVNTRIFRTLDPPPAAPNDLEPMKNVFLKPAPVLLGVVTCLASPPQAPSADEWREFEELTDVRSMDALRPSAERWREFDEATSHDPRIANEAAEVNQQIDEDTSRNEADLERMNEFLGGLDRQLVQADAPKQSEPAGDAKLGEPLELPKADLDKPALEVKCLGGMFFDAAEGVFVYNGKTQVRDPKFSLDCSKQLKVYFDPKAPAEGEEAAPAEPAAAPADANQEKAGLQKGVGELSRIAATGSVVVRSKNAKGESITATAEIMTYDAKTGVILLRGGRLTVQQGDKFMKVTGPNAFIKISEAEGAVAEGQIEQRMALPPKDKPAEGQP